MSNGDRVAQMIAPPEGMRFWSVQTVGDGEFARLILEPIGERQAPPETESEMARDGFRVVANLDAERLWFRKGPK